MRVSNALECLRSHFLSYLVRRGSMHSGFSSRHIGHSTLVYQVPEVLSVLSACKICVYHNWIWQSLSGRLSIVCCKYRGLMYIIAKRQSVTSYYVMTLCLCFGVWEKVDMAGFRGTLTLPVRCVSTRAIHSCAQCCVSKEPGVSLFGLAFHFIFISKCGRSVSVPQPLV